MKKTLHIDERLFREARSASRAKTDTDTVRLGLEALVRRGAYERLRALRGSEPHARDVARRRERASSARPGTRPHDRSGGHVRLDQLPVEPSAVWH